MNTFEKDPLKIAHTQLLPRSIKMLPKIISQKALPKNHSWTKKVVRRILYYSWAVDIKLHVDLSTVAAEQSKATEFTRDRVKQLFNYFAMHQNTKVRYKKLYDTEYSLWCLIPWCIQSNKQSCTTLLPRMASPRYTTIRIEWTNPYSCVTPILCCFICCWYRTWRSPCTHQNGESYPIQSGRNGTSPTTYINSLGQFHCPWNCKWHCQGKILKIHGYLILLDCKSGCKKTFHC